MPPHRAAFIRSVENTLLTTFGRWGYQEVRTPAMEYVETMARGLEPSELDIAFKLVDRYTGRMMMLRSDVTPQVARMAAVALQDVLRPLRLCYIANVYRYPVDPGHPRRELIQAGAELLGLDDPQADAEAVALGVAALQSMGLKAINISVGQVGFARGILSGCGLSPEMEDRLMEAAHRKDRAEMERLLEEEDVPGKSGKALLALTELYGDENVIDKAQALAPNKECKDALGNLREVLGLLDSYGVDRDLVQVDLGELAGFRYHTGIVFAGFVSGAGKAVLKGGRYDGLVGGFGDPAPATGFAIDILELVEIVSRSGESAPAIDYLLVNRTGDREMGLRLARDLRDRGLDVLCLIRELPHEQLIRYAGEHRIENVLILDVEGKLSRMDPSTGKVVPCDLEEL